MTERVVLVGVARKTDASAMASSIEELHRLTETAGGDVVDTLQQRLERFHPATLIGEGKVAELAQTVRRHKARTVIFDEELSPAQQKNIETTVGAKILDRTRLILDIFARRARTREGELQVELAQLSYLLPRLTGSWRAYSQQVGGIGTRGPGERQLEYERRHIRRRIEHLKRALERVRDERNVQRRRRGDVPVPQVAIIGYTNVGKSTLLNALIKESGDRRACDGKNVYADDKLFATLDPTTRRVRLPEGSQAVFTDTVGFIQKLPTTLVAAFRSTLEEVTRADCLIHVADATAVDRDSQTRAVDAVLAELGAEIIPRVEAANKADLLTEEERRKLQSEEPRTSLISAREGTGLKELLRRVQEVIYLRWVLREIDLDPGRTEYIRQTYRSAQVLGQTFRNGKLRLRLRITPENWSRLISKCRHQ